ncbi:MAG: FumA C-terminus/TtdB family hydratase beta subunit [Coriobacteriia bacterium]|nr:FumA C-terminus/TtdB family hydratase beta subunit [Coriobacteriia bacterium]
MSDAIQITLPGDAGRLRALPAGSAVLLSGPVYTARDATHVRLVADVEAGSPPIDLRDQVLFYAGPTPAAAGRPVGSVGPTTASRMDGWTPQLLEVGIAATIGKGVRSAAVLEACIANGAVYLATVGGIAALLATRVRSADTVAYADLGAEALVRMELDEFPVWVAIDATGADWYAEARAEWAVESQPQGSGEEAR